MMTTGVPRYDLALFGMEGVPAHRGRPTLLSWPAGSGQKMAPVLRQIYEQMADPNWVLSMGVCASSGGMFNNYAIVRGRHVVPRWTCTCPGCPPRPEISRRDP